jgi:hypothetical protein
MDRGKFRVRVGRPDDDAHGRSVTFLDEPVHHSDVMTRSQFAHEMHRRYSDMIDPFTWEYVDWIGGDPLIWPTDPAESA